MGSASLQQTRNVQSTWTLTLSNIENWKQPKRKNTESHPLIYTYSRERLVVWKNRSSLVKDRYTEQKTSVVLRSTELF